VLVALRGPDYRRQGVPPLGRSGQPALQPPQDRAPRPRARANFGTRLYQPRWL